MEFKVNDVVRALYDYNQLKDDELDVKKDETYIITDINETDVGWIKAKRLTPTESNEGFIYSKLFVPFNDEDRNQDWYFNVTTHEESKRLLLNPKNNKLAFFVREAYNIAALQLKTDVKKVGGWQFNCESGFYRINADTKVKSLKEVVERYKGKNKIRDVCYREPIAVPLRPLIVGNIDDVKNRFEKTTNYDWGELWTEKNGHRTIGAKSLAMVEDVNYDDLELTVNSFDMFYDQNLLQVLGLRVDKDNLILFSEAYNYGSLLDVLKTPNVDLPINFDESVCILNQVVSGMCYLEEGNYPHGNLRAKNIRIGPNYIVKIDAFWHNNCEAFAFTNEEPQWRAPECITSMENLTIKSDVYSFGVLIVEVFSKGQIYYLDKDYPPAAMYIQEASTDAYKYERMSKESTQFAIMAMKCWYINPTRRPSFSELHQEFKYTKFEPSVPK